MDQEYFSAYQRFMGGYEAQIIYDLAWYETELKKDNPDYNLLNQRIMHRYNKLLEKMEQLSQTGEISISDIVRIDDGISLQEKISIIRANLEKLKDYGRNAGRKASQEARKTKHLKDITETGLRKRPKLEYGEELFKKALYVIVKSLTDGQDVKSSIKESMKDEYPFLSHDQYRTLISKSLAYFSISKEAFTDVDIALISEWEKNKGKKAGNKSHRKSSSKNSQPKSKKGTNRDTIQGDSLSRLRSYTNNSIALRRVIDSQLIKVNSYYKLEKYKEEILGRVSKIENEMDGLPNDKCFKLELKRHKLIVDVLPIIQEKMDVIINEFVSEIFENNEESELATFFQNYIDNTKERQQTSKDNDRDFQSGDTIEFQQLVSGIYEEEEVNSAIDHVNERITISDALVRNDFFESNVLIFINYR